MGIIGRAIVGVAQSSATAIGLVSHLSTTLRQQRQDDLAAKQAHPTRPERPAWPPYSSPATRIATTVVGEVFGRTMVALGSGLAIASRIGEKD